MECYPMAKAGGMGDVVGALPGYINQNEGYESSVLIPKYHNKWALSKEWDEVYKGSILFNHSTLSFTIERLRIGVLDFDLYVVDIPGLFDRAGVYADEDGYFYEDEVKRTLAYQRSVLKWIASWEVDRLNQVIFHCHDHHTGLIPFMTTYVPEYANLKGIPTLYTIHNGRYQGAFSWDYFSYLPTYDTKHYGLLEWGGSINPMASAVKCCWWVNTVSEGYLEELKNQADGLEALLNQESQKCSGILNGIDTHVWNPSSDPYLKKFYKNKLGKFKKKSKKHICNLSNLDDNKPLMVFIGRLNQEKGADLLPVLAEKIELSGQFSLVILGTGDKGIEAELSNKTQGFQSVRVFLKYDEKFAHQLYAGMDYLFMPSRIEPCGLNQMFAMRYGGVPIVRKTGGLADSVRDIGETGGYGITFSELTVDELIRSLHRAVELYGKKTKFKKIRKRCFNMDFSWQKSVRQYLELYNKLINVKKL